MNPRPTTVTHAWSIDEAARQILSAHVKWLFGEDDGKPIGVISQSPIVGAVADGKVWAASVPGHEKGAPGGRPFVAVYSRAQV